MNPPQTLSVDARFDLVPIVESGMRAICFFCGGGDSTGNNCSTLCMLNQCEVVAQREFDLALAKRCRETCFPSYGRVLVVTETGKQCLLLARPEYKTSCFPGRPSSVTNSAIIREFPPYVG